MNPQSIEGDIRNLEAMGLETHGTEVKATPARPLESEGLINEQTVRASKKEIEELAKKIGRAYNADWWRAYEILLTSAPSVSSGVSSLAANSIESFLNLCLLVLDGLDGKSTEDRTTLTEVFRQRISAMQCAYERSLAPVKNETDECQQCRVTRYLHTSLRGHAFVELSGVSSLEKEEKDL